MRYCYHSDALFVICFSARKIRFHMLPFHFPKIIRSPAFDFNSTSGTCTNMSFMDMLLVQKGERLDTENFLTIFIDSWLFSDISPPNICPFLGVFCQWLFSLNSKYNSVVGHNLFLSSHPSSSSSLVVCYFCIHNQFT